MKIQILHKTSISLISVENPSLCRSSQPPPIKSSRNAIFPIIYPKYFPFAIITFLVNLNIHQIPLPRFILKVYCPIKLLNNELVCVMTQHRKVAADENIFVNTHNERRGDDGEKWGDHAAAGTRSPGAASRVGRLQSAQRRTSCFSVLGPNISLCKALHFGSAATPMSLWIVNIMSGR